MNILLGKKEMRDSNFEYVFICGAKRSGTTILTSLLDGHPNLFVFPGEFQAFSKEALGKYDMETEYNVSEFMESISFYIDELRLQNKESYNNNININKLEKNI